VYIPVGGGGLLAGVASALDETAPWVRIVAVEPEGCPSLHAALAAGAPVTVPCTTICDGVAVPYITDEMFPLLADLVDDAVLVSERAVRAAVKSLALANKMVAEPSGALALAAALATPAEERGETVCLVTGGSIDRDLLVDILRDDTL
jgi:threonine dehydratase